MAIVVAKFGGTSVGTGERIQKAAKSVVNEYMQGNKVIVVVSAINKTTDESIKLVQESMGKLVTEKQLAGILSMGEMQSVRIMAATIESLGVKAEYIDPFSEKWPVITDSNYLEAKIDKVKTEKKGTKDYYKILKLLGNKADTYEGLNDESIKRLYFPTVVFVKNGRIVDTHMSTLDSQKDPYKKLNKKQRRELKKIYIENIKKINGIICSSDIAC